MIRDFHDDLQKMADKYHRLPLLIAVDFEGPRFTSLKQGVTIPPPAITLASTQDTELIKSTGQFVGNQLRTLGINMLLGPVVDVDITQQGLLNESIQNRSFGSNPERVYSLSSHYIKGIQEGGVSVIAKHFPGCNDTGNTHNEIPTYEGTAKNFFEQHLPYSHFSSIVDGIMTNHINVGFVEPNLCQPVTFSKVFVSELLRTSNEVKIGSQTQKGFGYNEKVIITDDLSNMGAVINYMEKYNKTFGQIAVEAFDAGHDILLFSHLEIEGAPARGKYEKFDMDSLREVKSALIEHISNNPQKEKQFRESLKRILLLKYKVDELEKSPFEKNYNYFTRSYVESITKPEFLKEKGFTDGKDLISKVIDASVIEINSNTSYNLSKLTPNARIAFYIDNNHLDLFKKAFEGYLPHSDYFPVEHNKSDEKFENLKEKLTWDVREYDYLVYTVTDIDDANLMDHVVFQEKQYANKKLIILLHNTPKILKDRVLLNSSIFGTFTIHPYSYNTDIKVLKGEIKPNDISYLNIGLGSNDSFYNPEKEGKDAIVPAMGFNKVEYYETSEEEKLSRENQKLKKQIDTTNNTSNPDYIIFFRGLLLLFPVGIIFAFVYCQRLHLINLYNKLNELIKNHPLISVILGLAGISGIGFSLSKCYETIISFVKLYLGIL